ncbi:hypothetical protein [Mycobacterium sp.]|jgi:hypothetical protein|uniref:hypothetical protein n=1 Tax=Mycobacterium sp. TaxID=1785 RepID=UPI002D62E133|nr:hypothetical protein [Mycobacterium sp.]HZA10826.1 hypothetical protein [Mycobacterium sp.]
MTAPRRAIVELVLAAVAAAGCVLSWLQSRSTVDVAPILSGEPPTTSITYYAPLLVLALLLATVAGVLVVVAVARLRRRDDLPGSAEAQRPVANAEP